VGDFDGRGEGIESQKPDPFGFAQGRLCRSKGRRNKDGARFGNSGTPLRRDQAAGDAVAGVAGGVGLHVVGLGVDHEGYAAIAEKRVRVGAEGDIVIDDGRLGRAGAADGEVGHVAGVMAVGIFEAVLFAVGVEMRSGGLEVRCIAFGVLMEMQRVLAGRQVLQVELDRHAGLCGLQRGGADALAFGVLEFDNALRAGGEKRG